MAQWRLFTKRDHAQLAGGSVEEFAEEIRKYPFLDNYEHSSGGKLPRNHLERCYRLTKNQDVLASTVIRYLRANNCIEVQSFLVEESRELEPFAATRELLIFLLSEAFRCSGVMALQFALRAQRGVRPTTVPPAVLAVSESYGVPIDKPGEGVVTHAEGRRLFVELTNFSPAARKAAEQLDLQGLTSIERTCFLIHRGLWTRREMEMILLGCPYPELVLGAGTAPFERHLTQFALIHARTTILGGMLDQVLARRPSRTESDSILDFDDDEIDLEIEFDASISAKRYRGFDEPLKLMWALTEKETDLSAGTNLTVLIRSRRGSEISEYLEDDFEVAENLTNRKKKGDRVAILLPFDFYSLPDQDRDKYATRSRKSGVSLLICPDGLTQLTAEANRRLASAKIIRL